MTEREKKSSEGGLGRQAARPTGLDRRQFLRSIFGLGSIAEGAAEQEVQAAAPGGAGKFIWTDLRTGQMGFPCGHGVPAGMPGSIMKLVSSAALVNANLLSPDEKFECRGVYKVNNHTYKCQFAHGLVDMVHALGLSCNIYFAHASKKISARALLDYAAQFGLNQAVAEFPAGKFPAESATSAGSSSEQYVLGLAEDLQPSALQLLRVSALIGNKGKVPYMHSAENPNPQGKPFELELSQKTWQVLKEGMELASRHGTGKKLDPENKLKLAIKTGTTPHGKSFQSWITGFFPWDAPRYAFILRAAAGTSQDEAVPQARSFLFSADWP